MPRKNDKAVVRIGMEKDKDKLGNILKNPESFSREDFLKAIMENYSGTAYGDENWPKFTGGWTTPKEPTIYGNFREQHSNLAQLSLDPGFLTHLPEFFDFTKNNNVNEKNYWNTREKFKEFLGYKEVYRGLMLTEKETEKIKKQGLHSDFFRDSDFKDRGPWLVESRFLSCSFNDLVESHFHRENPYTFLLSLSSHQDIAIVAGEYYGKRGNEKELYLFKLKVPEIDIIYFTDHAVRTPYKVRAYGILRPRLGVMLNRKKNVYEWDRNTESFVLFKINHNEIIKVSKPEVYEFLLSK